MGSVWLTQAPLLNFEAPSWTGADIQHSNLVATRISLSQMMLLLTTDSVAQFQNAGCRQGAPPAEPFPPKSSFKNLHFRQSKGGDVLIVSRTLSARMAAPHTLQLDHLKLTSCCLIEGVKDTTKRLLHPDIVLLSPCTGQNAWWSCLKQNNVSTKLKPCVAHGIFLDVMPLLAPPASYRNRQLGCFFKHEGVASASASLVNRPDYGDHAMSGLLHDCRGGAGDNAELPAQQHPSHQPLGAAATADYPGHVQQQYTKLAGAAQDASAQRPDARSQFHQQHRQSSGMVRGHHVTLIS